MNISRAEKFKNKNSENIDKLNKFIDENKKNINLIIASTDMYYLIQAYYETEEINDDMLKYRGKRVIRDCYMHPSFIGFMMLDQMIKFNVPCLCGIYEGEVHP